MISKQEKSTNHWWCIHRRGSWHSIYFFHDYFKWIGKLPGDISIEKGHSLLLFSAGNNDCFQPV